ncbi:hypothetical protein MMC28_000024 [Mycoblastus sanguinarius]|nr:hypothetical protein [Mycoblastus sanguinarius]
MSSTLMTAENAEWRISAKATMDKLSGISQQLGQIKNDDESGIDRVFDLTLQWTESMTELEQNYLTEVERLNQLNKEMSQEITARGGQLGMPDERFAAHQTAVNTAEDALRGKRREIEGTESDLAMPRAARLQANGEFNTAAAKAAEVEKQLQDRTLRLLTRENVVQAQEKTFRKRDTTSAEREQILEAREIELTSMRAATHSERLANEATTNTIDKARSVLRQLLGKTGLLDTSDTSVDGCLMDFEGMAQVVASKYTDWVLTKRNLVKERDHSKVLRTQLESMAHSHSTQEAQINSLLDEVSELKRRLASIPIQQNKQAEETEKELSDPISEPLTRKRKLNSNKQARRGLSTGVSETEDETIEGMPDSRPTRRHHTPESSRLGGRLPHRSLVAPVEEAPSEQNLENSRSIGRLPDRQSGANPVWLLDAVKDEAFSPAGIPAAVVRKLQSQIKDWDRKKADWADTDERKCADCVARKKGTKWTRKDKTHACSSCQGKGWLCVAVLNRMIELLPLRALSQSDIGFWFKEDN